AADRWGRGEVSIRDLFRSSLRLRPDRIVIGEVRGGEALDMIQAMTSGHAGSMSTLHANTAFDALNRLETMALMSKVELPLHALRSQISSAMDVIVLMTRLKDGRRCITEISEVLPLEEDGHYRVQKMFSFDVKDESDVGRLAWAGQRSTFYDEPKIRINRPEWRDAAKFFSQQTGENT
ncbi:MAG TPA: CpaF/VirB11 family protein, partial [Phycisphaerae bacterium]|nr:CpaF/VirB11 family protein [Phycisphaerae bacterium]